LQKTLIIGYGNKDRQDDGVAWYVLKEVAQQISGSQLDTDSNDLFEITPTLHLLFLLQLVPELAERIKDYERVCFVDAHTGNIPDDIRATELSPKYKRSPFTHHFTPESLLEICSTIYQKHPKSLLVSVRGYEFGFEDTLSLKTCKLVPLATDKILDWIQEEKGEENG